MMYFLPFISMNLIQPFDEDTPFNASNSNPWFSKYGFLEPPWNLFSSITWKFVRGKSSQVPSQTHELEILGWGLEVCVLTSPLGDRDVHSVVRITF